MDCVALVSVRVIVTVSGIVGVTHYQGVDLDASSLVDIKMLTVNETLGSETRPRHLTFSPRRDRDLPRFLRDRDETETLKKRSRDRLETETSRPRLHSPCNNVMPSTLFFCIFNYRDISVIFTVLIFSKI